MNRRTPAAFAALFAAGFGISLAANAERVSPGEVQGPGDSSPLEGHEVIVQGVVTGDFQDHGGTNHGSLGGFYIASVEPDANPQTSEGLFVFEGGRPVKDVEPGDIVEATGKVVEHFGETQLVAERIDVVGNAQVVPVDLAFPITSFEAYEGMLVRFPGELLIAGNRNLGRFGELQLAAGERPYHYTNRNAPDRGGFRAAQEDFAANSVILDDGMRTENPNPLRYTGDDVPPRAGNAITGLSGNVRWSRGSGGKGNEHYRIMPTVNPRIEDRNPRALPPDPAGKLRIAGFNLLNLFSGLGQEGEVCGPKADSRCRGASTRDELTRQLDKTAVAFRLLNADIVAIAEAENNASESLDLLLDALKAEGLEYAYVDAGVIGDGSIKVGLVYRPARIEAVGDFALLTKAEDGRFDDRRSRPALAQTFSLRDNGARVTVIANHLKSKGSDCDDVNDPNVGDGQGNCNRTRAFAAASLADWSANCPTETCSHNVLIMGDLNAYLREDPIRALEAGGFVNLLDRDHGDNAYTYVFAGRAGALDHAFASAGLAAMVLKAFAWHSNADEPQVFDYNLDFGRNPRLFDSESPWRSSDHDPVVVDIELSP